MCGVFRQRKWGIPPCCHVAGEISDNVVHLCEMKFLSDEFEVDRDYHLVLERRKNLLSGSVSRKAAIHNTLITTYGLKKTQHFDMVVRAVDLGLEEADLASWNISFR